MNLSRHEDFYGRAFAAAIAATVIIAMVAPRFTGIAPPIIALAFYSAYRFVHARWLRVPKNLLFWSLLFPALMAASALWSEWPETALDRALRTLPVTLSGGVLLAVGLNLKPNAGEFFRRVFPAAVLIAALICVAEIYLKGPIYHLFHEPDPSEKRFNLSQLNRSVAVLTLSAPVAFGCLLAARIKARTKNIIAGGILFLLAMILYGSSSQSSQLALLLAGIFCFLFPYRRKEAWAALAGIIALALATTPWLTQYMFHHWADAIAESGIRMGYMQYRMEIWDTVSRRALENPLLGHGAEATKMMKDLDPEGRYWTKHEILHPHNFAVQIWVEFGALGAALAAAFFAVVLKRIRGLGLPAARVFLPLFIACLSVAATGYGIWQTWWIGIFCLSFAAAPLLIKPEKHGEKL